MEERTRKMDSEMEELRAPEVLSLWIYIWIVLGKWGVRPLAQKTINITFASTFSCIDLWSPGAGVPTSLYPEQNPIRQIKEIHKELHSLTKGQFTKNMMGSQPRSHHLQLFLAVHSMRLLRESMPTSNHSANTKAHGSSALLLCCSVSMFY